MASLGNKTALLALIGIAASVSALDAQAGATVNIGPDGRLKQPTALSINKIGHAMHDLDPVFEAFTRDAKLAAVARDLGLEKPQVWQSM
jgi:hypothetical protein